MRTASVIILFFLASIVLAGQFDTGFRQLSQPNGVTFVGREWGDEFFHWAETQDGYLYVRAPNWWYYYAMLDARAEFAASSSRVGIDPAPASAYMLQRTQSRINAINAQIVEFNQRVDSSRALFLQVQARARARNQAVQKRLGALLIDFPDAPHFQDPEHPRRPFGYLRSDFDSMLYSQGYWYKPNPTPQDTSPHPENHAVFGSMHDYYWQMSRPNDSAGALILTGRVINPASAYGVPRWITLHDSMAHYDDETMFTEAYQTALDSQYFNPSEFDLYVAIYAGPENIIHTGAHPPEFYFIPERIAASFNHIGTHCHEFGHLLGFSDQYFPPTPTQFFDLMGSGNINGPLLRGECPASICPYYRTMYGWVTPRMLERDTTNLVVAYDYEHPVYYRVNPIDRTTHPDEHFLLETRLHRGTFDLYTPTGPADSNVQSGTLLTWRHNSGSDSVAIMQGCLSCDYWGLNWFFPADRTRNSQNYNDDTSPGTIMEGNRLAHFALNRIHRNISTNLTQIDTFIASYGVRIISRNTTWSGAMSIDAAVRVIGDATLTIEPGTRITFVRASSGVVLYNNSRLIAIGQPSQIIELKSSSGIKGSWVGIQARDSATISVSYARIKDALFALQSNQSFGTMIGVHISNCNSGISIGQGRPILTSCVFENNDNALSITSQDTPEVSNSAFLRNTLSIVCNSSSPRIVSNEFKNGITEIDLVSGVSPEVSHNLFVGNRDTSLYGLHMRFESAGAIPGPLMPRIVNNSVGFYRYGCLADVPPPGFPAPTPTLRNNIFFLNDFSTSPNGGTIQGQGTLRYSNIYNKDTLTYTPPPTNIAHDPMFVNPDSGNFALRYFSPSIDAGDSSDAYNLEPEPNGHRINQGHQGNTPQATRSFNVVAYGSLTSNTMWSGNILVQGDLSVTSSVTLTVARGAVVRVAPGATITVLGTLSATGVPGSPLDSITFMRDVADSPWQGIVFQSGSSASVMRYCSVTGARTGVSLELTNPTIDHSLFDACDDGIDLYTVHPKIRIVITSNEIRNCKCGIYVHNSPYVELRGNDIHANNVGVYVFQSSPKLYQNTIETNTTYGVYSEAADPRFGDMIVNDRGCNTIRLNTTNDGTADLYASGGNPFLGFYDGQQTQGGYNSVYSNGVGGAHCIVVADKGAVITAQVNWWGHYPPDQSLFCANDGKIDYSKPLDGAPTQCNGNIAQLSLPADSEEQILRTALTQRGHRNYSSALGTYATFVANRPSSNNVRRALRELWQTYRDYRIWADDSTLQNQLVDYLTNVYISHPNASLRLTANMLLADELHCMRAWSATTAKYRQIVQAQPNTNYERVALFSLFSVNAYGLRDTAAAGNTLLTLRSRYPDDPHTGLAEIRYALLTRRVSGQLGKPLNPSAPVASTRPDHYALDQNYPNPFNPTTSIQYQLREDGFVLLKVYDILGREVTTLVNEQQRAGYYKTSFRPSRLASGVYFYRLQVGSFVDTKKLLLVK